MSDSPIGYSYYTVDGDQSFHRHIGSYDYPIVGGHFNLDDLNTVVDFNRRHHFAVNVRPAGCNV